MKESIASKIRVIRLTVSLIILILIVLLTGCIGGKSTNARGTGTTITPSRLIPQPNGTFKLEPIINAKDHKSKPVKIESVRSRPIPPDLPSATPTLIKPKMNVIPIKDPPKVTISTNTNQASELPIIIDNNWRCGTKDPEIAGPCEEEPVVKVNWMELIKFYLLAAGFLALMYFGWKAARKKTEAMIAEERGKKKAPKKRVKKRK